MAEAHQRVADVYQASSALAKYPFEPYWPEGKLKICITGAGGFIARCERRARNGLWIRCTLLLFRQAPIVAPPTLPSCSHLAKRLKSEGHYIIGCGECRCSVLAHALRPFAHSIRPILFWCRLEAQRAYAGESGEAPASQPM
jgi:hypothetical protein